MHEPAGAMEVTCPPPAPGTPTLRRRRTRLVPLVPSLSCTLGALLLFLPSQGHAQEPDDAVIEGTIPQIAADDSPLLWTASALHRILIQRDYPTALLLASVAHSLEAEGDPTVLEGLDRVLAGFGSPTGPGARRAPADLQRCRDATDPVDGILCSLETLAPLAPPILARRMTEEGSRLVSLYLHPAETGPQLPGQGPRGRERWGLGPLQSFAEEALEATLRVRAASLLLPPEGDPEEDTGDDPRGAPPPGVDVPPLETALSIPELDRLLSRTVGLTPGASAGELLARSPVLQELLGLHPAVAQALGGGVPPRPAAILGEYTGFLNSLTSSLRTALREPASGDEGLDRWASHRSFIYLAARSAGLAGGEGELPQRIRVFGNAAADLHRSGGAFTSHLATVGSQVAMGALSGNLFAVAAGITSFLEVGGGMGPGAAQDLRAIREGMAGIQQEMEERFDEVDARLTDLFHLVDTRFQHLERIVATRDRAIQGELRAIHGEVLALGQRMDRMETNLRSYMQAGFDRDYNRTLIRCLEHRDRHLPPHDEMDFATFAGCLTEFRARAVQDARDALLTDQETPVEDAALVEALSDPGLPNLSRRLPLLGRVASRRFGHPGLRGGLDLANPVEWAMAVRAYLAMLQEWPEHARSVAPGDLEAMRAVGADLQGAIRSIAVGGSVHASDGLLLAVLGAYEARAAELTAEADGLARRHEQAHLRRIAWEDLVREITPLDQGRPSLHLPGWLADQVPQELRTAGVLGVDEPRMGYRLVVRDSVSRENVRRTGLFRRLRHDRLTFTRTAMEVTLRAREAGAVTTFRTTGPWVLARQEEIGGGVESDRVRSSREIVPDPAGQFLSNAWPSLSGSPAGWSVPHADSRTLGILEERIQEELQQSELQALNQVFTAVCQDAARGSTLAGPDRESALRMEAALEGMTAARLLLRAYLRLGFPAALEGDSEIRRALEGPEALLDHTGLCGAVAAGESPLRLVWLEEEPARRAAELALALSRVLDRPGALPESMALVEDTVRELEVSLRLQRIRSQVARAESPASRTGPGW